MRTGEQTIGAFCEQVAASTPAPGGGAVSAVAGALGASLVSMVAGLTRGREKYREVEADMAAAQEAGGSPRRCWTWRTGTRRRSTR